VEKAPSKRVTAEVQRSRLEHLVKERRERQRHKFRVTAETLQMGHDIGVDESSESAESGGASAEASDAGSARKNRGGKNRGTKRAHRAHPRGRKRARRERNGSSDVERWDSYSGSDEASYSMASDDPRMQPRLAFGGDGGEDDDDGDEIILGALARQRLRKSPRAAFSLYAGFLAACLVEPQFGPAVGRAGGAERGRFAGTARGMLEETHDTSKGHAEASEWKKRNKAALDRHHHRNSKRAKAKARAAQDGAGAASGDDDDDDDNSYESSAGSAGGDGEVPAWRVDSDCYKLRARETVHAAVRQIEGGMRDTRTHALASNVWSPNFHKVLDRYTVLDVEEVSVDASVKCGVCRRGGHTISARLEFRNPLYSAEAYARSTVDALHGAAGAVCDLDERVHVYAGRMCSARARLFHASLHFKYNFVVTAVKSRALLAAKEHRAAGLPLDDLLDVIVQGSIEESDKIQQIDLAKENGKVCV
jgi:hypothetical protein